MRSPWRAVFAIVCWLPAATVVVLSVWMQSSPVWKLVMAGKLDRLEHLPLSAFVPFLLIAGGAVLLQIGLATWVALYCDKRGDLSQTEKIMWPVGVLFVGSIVTPIFYFKKVRRFTPY
ncbi:MAG: hypothetical protein KF773_38955 [Deltaproteobacteria bacterium]|nr:hypothetical protein [Deltaproteobacteria bacterium]MCW5808115.1 hypothetical protein [Deltaproteobacteria bacterium]